VAPSLGTSLETSLGSRPPQHEWLLSGVVGGFLVMISLSFIYTACEYFIEHWFQTRHVRRSYLCGASSFMEKLYALWSLARTCPYQPKIDRFDLDVEYYNDEINTGDEIYNTSDSMGWSTLLPIQDFLMIALALLSLLLEYNPFLHNTMHCSM
jgi:hypothetical protein